MQTSSKEATVTMAPGEVGHQQMKDAYAAYEELADKPKASGVVLHRKDELVADGKFKWVPCIWKINNEGALTLQPIGGIAQEADAMPITCDTQYKAPKSKHYPLQFGLATTVYTTALLRTVTYQATGYASSPFDMPGTAAGTNAVESMGKVAALEKKDLEKLLVCIQAVKEGKSPEAYLGQLGE